VSVNRADRLPKILATERENGIYDDAVARTPETMPDLKIEVMTIAARAGVRAFRTFLQALLAGFGVGIVGPNIPLVSDIFQPGKEKEKAAAVLVTALVAALVAACQLTFELTQRWDVDHPKLLG
jgi:hypothetical protein